MLAWLTRQCNKVVILPFLSGLRYVANCAELKIYYIMITTDFLKEFQYLEIVRLLPNELPEDLINDTLQPQ